MALRGEPATAVVFREPEVPFLQFHTLEAVDSIGRRHRFQTYQNDTQWGLCVRTVETSEQRLLESEWTGIYRLTAPVDELPTGMVEQVNLLIEDGDIEEVTLVIDSKPLLLVAGEVWEMTQNRLEFHRFDESVLAFTDQATAEEIEWIPARNR